LPFHWPFRLQALCAAVLLLLLLLLMRLMLRQLQPKQPPPLLRGPAVGIITGSGPEAGVDLVAKVLVANRQRRQSEPGAAFHGDKDAPRVVLISEPELGLSMSLAEHESEVWQALAQAVLALPASVEFYAVACITLHYYADRLQTLAEDNAGPRFISAVELVAVEAEREQQAGHRVAVVGSTQTMDLQGWSPFKPFVQLAGHPHGGARPRLDLESVAIPSGADQDALHALIHAVKTDGPLPRHTVALAKILGRLDADVVFLACTELPLLLLSSPGASDVGAQSGASFGAAVLGGKRVVDVTALLADRLVVLARSGGHGAG
jgi:aspartate racemase